MTSQLENKNEVKFPSKDDKARQGKFFENAKKLILEFGTKFPADCDGQYSKYLEVGLADILDMPKQGC